MRIGVLASGSGTVCEAILDAGLPVRLVLADRDCPALVLAAARGVDAVLVPRSFDSSFDRSGYTRRVRDTHRLRTDSALFGQAAGA